MKQSTKLLIFLVVIAALAAQCFAPIRLKTNTGYHGRGRASEADLERFQAMGVVIAPQKGPLPERTSADVSAPSTDLSAGANLSAAARHQERGANAIREAGRAIASKQEDGRPSWPFGLILAISGIAAVMGLRSYANKVVPLDARGLPLKTPKMW